MPSSPLRYSKICDSSSSKLLHRLFSIFNAKRSFVCTFNAIILCLLLDTDIDLSEGPFADFVLNFVFPKKKVVAFRRRNVVY